MRPVDSHCHLQFEQFDEDRGRIVEEVEENLEFAVLAGINPEDNQKAIELSKTSESLKYCLGLHPLHHRKPVEKARQQIEEHDPVAVGEIGLDYNYITDKEERKDSEKVFREILEIAENRELPAVIHSRNAEKKCFDIVNGFEVEAFFHCFNGRPELARKIAEEDHKVGVTTQVADSKRVRNIVKKISMESILLETDSPYLGLNGRNTPFNVGRVAKEIADIKSIDLERVKRISTRSSAGFFG